MHMVTLAELYNFKARVAELEATIRTSGIKAEDGQLSSYAYVERIHTVPKVHDEAESGCDIGNNVKGQI